MRWFVMSIMSGTTRLPAVLSRIFGNLDRSSSRYVHEEGSLDETVGTEIVVCV